MAPPGLLKDGIVHGLDAQFDAGHAVLLQALQYLRRNAVRPGRTADGGNRTGLQGFVSRLQKAFLYLPGHGRETAAVESHFPVARRPGRRRIGRNETAHLIGRRQALMSRNLPLITEDTAVGTADMGNENRDDRRLHDASRGMKKGLSYDDKPFKVLAARG